MKEDAQVELDDSLAKANTAYDSGRYFDAAHYYKSALVAASKLGRKDAIKFCKHRLVEANRLSLPGFTVLSGETQVDLEQVRRLRDAIIGGGSLSEALVRIGSQRCLCPEIEKIKEKARKTMPIHAVICNFSEISKDGHVLRGSSDGANAHLMNCYESNQTMIAGIYLPSIYNELIANGRVGELLNAEALTKYLLESNVLSETDKPLVARGIAAFFDRDYIPAVHIMVPRFESVFLRLSAANGISTISFGQKGGVSTAPITLGEAYLEAPEFIEVWGDDLCWQIKFILFSPLGYKLRHKVAHGEISDAECGFETAGLIIYLYLVLAYRCRRASQTPQNQCCVPPRVSNCHFVLYT